MAETDHGRRIETARHGLVGNGFGQGVHHGVIDPVAGQQPGAHGRRRPGIEDRAVGRLHLDGARRAVVERNVGAVVRRDRSSRWVPHILRRPDALKRVLRLRSDRFGQSLVMQPLEAIGGIRD